MDFLPSFKPVDLATLQISPAHGIYEQSVLLHHVHFYDGKTSLNVSDTRVVIMGIPEARGSFQNRASSLAPDEIRRQFYSLYVWKKSIKIIDLGNLITGDTLEDTYAILSEIVSWCIENDMIPIVLGGSNDLVFPCYLAYEKLCKMMNLVLADARFDIGNDQKPIDATNYLSKIITRKPNYLLNFANIGYQTYFNSPEAVLLMDKLFFEHYRVGIMRQNLEEAEPVVRDADMVAIDVSVIRRPDAPGNPHASPNGFYGEEMCRIARYAGLSDRLSAFGLFEFDPTLDCNNQTSQLLAQILWHFIEGVIFRQNDTSFSHRGQYVKYSMEVSGTTNELVFYRSKITGRWWVVVPVVSKKKKDINRNYFLPCSQADYDMACNDIVPERWWHTFHKLNN